MHNVFSRKRSKKRWKLNQNRTWKAKSSVKYSQKTYEDQRQNQKGPKDWTDFRTKMVKNWFSVVCRSNYGFFSTTPLRVEFAVYCGVLTQVDHWPQIDSPGNRKLDPTLTYLKKLLEKYWHQIRIRFSLELLAKSTFVSWGVLWGWRSLACKTSQSNNCTVLF